jgi:tight adherence protein B
MLAASFINQTVQTWLFFLLPAAGSILLMYGVFQVILESRHGERKRMEDRLRGASAARAKKEQQISSILKRHARGEAKDALTQLVGRLRFINRIQTLLDQANVDWSASRMMINLSAIALITATVLLLAHFSVFAAVGCGASVVLLPLIYLSFRRKRRMKKLTTQLPDVFEMMSQALRAGHSLASAIQLVHEQMPDPIGTEFGRVFHEQNLGVKIEDALTDMANRVDSLDVRFFVTAVLIQRQTGGDLAEVLDKIGSLIRDRIQLFGMVQALTAEGRLSGWVLFLLPIIVFFAAMALNREYASVMITEPMGKAMLFVAAGMQIMGMAMIRWIVNIKV